MGKIVLSFFIFILLFSNSVSPQIANQFDVLKWNIDPRTSPMINRVGIYSDLPQYNSDRKIDNFTRIFVISGLTYVVSPNFRVLPRDNGTQSETIIKRHPIDAFIMFGSANTFSGEGVSTPAFVTVDGGLSWYGSDTLMSINNNEIYNYGDPGPTIDKNGRFIITYIALSERMGSSYSTNSGISWSNTQNIPGSSAFPDKNFASSDDDPASPYYGSSFIVFNEFSGPNLLRVVNSYTTNGGSNWANVRAVSPYPTPGHFHQGADVAAGPGGIVYVVWSNSIINGQNSTEDSLGFAMSTNGGANWIYTTNSAVDINGIRTDNLLNGIRANGFPRIDIDRTNCGSRRGWIYVVTAEKFFEPARGPADIVLNTSSDDGATWSRTKVNQNTDSSDIEYFPAIKVDETGDINIVYYSTRNSVDSTQVEVFLSRSTDGGLTFSDILISDQPFTPATINGTSGGYQGDYIGITSGNGKVWPFWAENSVTGRYQAWTASVNITGNLSCLSSNKYYVSGDFRYQFPPNDMYFTYCDSPVLLGQECELYWERSTASAFGNDTGSARFNAFDAPTGVTQSLQSFNFSALPQNTYLSFDHAYAPNSDSLRGPDSLIIEVSSNGGLNFSSLAFLHGSKNGGSLNTASATSLSFTPSDSQWASKLYMLPEETNKIKFRCVSGNGNNIYLDNIAVQVLPAPVASNISLCMEGFYNNSSHSLSMNDTVRFYLQRNDFSNIVVDSAISIVDSVTLSSSPVFSNALTGNYYIRIVHRNCIETWSKTGGELFTRGAVFSYDFLPTSSNAFKNNVKQVDTKPVRFALYSGNVNNDDYIDVTDILLINNDVIIFKNGYTHTDVNGDNYVDIEDVMITFNNSKAFISEISP